MALTYKPRVKETTTSTGTGPWTLAGASSRFQAVSTIGDGNKAYFIVESGTDWMEFIGLYTSAGNTLTVDTFLSSSTGSPLSLSGTSTIFLTPPTSFYSSNLPVIRARVMATSNVTLATGLENGDTVNGVTLATGDAVFLTGQTDQKENRVWVVKASGAPDPHPLMPTGANVTSWLVIASEGTLGKDRLYTCTSNTSVAGTDNLTWGNAASVMVGDSGSGGEIGVVPAPAAGDAAANKYFHADGTYKVVTAAAAAGPLPFNHLVNPSFRHWARNTKDPTAALTTADGAYGTTNWYTLADAATVTQQQVAGSTAPYALKLNTPSGSVSMWGCAQIVCKELTYSLRGKTVIFQARVKRSEAKKIRIALLEWTGTADAPTKDVVNNWASTNYTPGNFFISSNLTVIGTATTGTMSADTYNLVSVSGAVSSSATNLYVVIWSEDALSGNQSITVECPGLYEGSSAQTWAEGPTNELTNPLRYAYGIVKDELNHIWCVRNDTKYLEGIDFIHPVPMRAAPTLSHNISGWNNTAPTTTLIAAAYYASGTSAYVTITGSLTVTVSYTTKRKTQIYLTASSSFLGSSGNLSLLLPGPDVQFTNSAEIGV